MLMRLGYKVRLFSSAANAMFEFRRSPSDIFLTVYPNVAKAGYLGCDYHRAMSDGNVPKNEGP